MVLELNSCMTGPVRKNISYPLNTELELRIYGIGLRTRLPYLSLNNYKEK